MTIMEEGTELLHHLKEEPGQPCLPRAALSLAALPRRQKHPSLVSIFPPQESPQQIFGAIAKNYYAEILGVDPAKIAVVSIMPCVAKKAECAYEDMDTTGTGPDVDVVLTTRELGRMLKSSVHQRKEHPKKVRHALGRSHWRRSHLRRHRRHVEGGSSRRPLPGHRRNPDPDAFSAVRGCEAGARRPTLAGKRTLPLPSSAVPPEC